MPWIAGAIFTAAAANTVFADTGALATGFYDFVIIPTGNVGQEMLLQHRDSLNGTTLKEATIQVGQFFPPLQISAYWLSDSERIRVLARANVPASKESRVSIFYQLRAAGVIQR